MPQARALWPLVALAAAVALAAPPSSSARDRPGTPTGVYAKPCSVAIGEAYAYRPSICIAFYNTASESVTFAAEWTINGEVQNEPLRVLGVVCQTSGLYGDGQHCDAADTLNGRPPREVAMRAPQGVRLHALSFGVEYCFRFETIDEDGVVSEAWSNRVCVQTPPPPAPPPAPTNVHATLLPPESGVGSPGPAAPPRVLVEWDADDAGVGWYLVQRYDGRWAPQREPESGQVKPALNTAHEVTLATTAEDVAAHPMGVQFRVCAENITGETCSAPASTSNWTGTVERPRHDATEMTSTNRAQGDSRRPGADVFVPRAGTGQVDRPASVSTRGGVGSNACQPGFVWREARVGDVVCVAPLARGRVAQENAEAASHVDPAGAYGPNSCAPGYVWREAYEGDVVCASPAARAFAKQENADGPNHRADDGEVFRAPR